MEISQRRQATSSKPATSPDPRGGRFKLSPRGLLLTAILVAGASALVIVGSVALYDRHKPIPPPVLDLRPPRDHPWQTQHIPLYYACNSNACRSTGEDLRKNVAWSLSPCDDFYEYVCSSDRPATNVLAYAVSHFLLEVRSVIKRYDDLGWFRRTPMTKKVTRFFRTCTSAERSPWSSQLDSVWKLLKLKDEQASLEEQLALFSRHFHVFPLVDVSIMKLDGKNCLTLSRPEDLVADPLFQVPHAFSRAFDSFVGDLVGTNDTSDVLKVETLLAQFSGPLGERFKKLRDYGQLPAYELRKGYFDWVDYLTKLFKGAAAIDPDSCVISRSPLYVKHVIKVLQRATQPELRAFLRYRAALQLLPFRRLAQLDRKAGRNETDQLCNLLTYRLYKYAFMRHFNDSSILKVYVNTGEKEVIVRMSYRHILTSTQPVTIAQREVDQSIKKATADYLRHMSDVDKYYGAHHPALDAQHIAASFVAVQGSMAKNWLKTVVASGGKVMENQLQVRWHYDPDSGRLTVPVSIAPMDVEGTREFFLETSTLGSAMVRFIYTAFHEGYLFREAGMNATGCLMRQYDALKAANSSVNGRRTLHWNMADTAVVPALHRAFKTSLYIHKIEVINYKKLEMSLENLPDVDADQLFFLMYGQTFCDADEDTQRVISQAPWAPARFRVNVPFSNYEEFAKAFKCPAGTRMNPTTRCNPFRLV